ncbi:hypothetical protein JZ751_003261, partial [Albula glossodonta]
MVLIKAGESVYLELWNDFNLLPVQKNEAGSLLTLSLPLAPTPLRRARPPPPHHRAGCCQQIICQSLQSEGQWVMRPCTGTPERGALEQRVELQEQRKELQEQTEEPWGRAWSSRSREYSPGADRGAPGAERGALEQSVELQAQREELQEQREEPWSRAWSSRHRERSSRSRERSPGAEHGAPGAERGALEQS